MCCLLSKSSVTPRGSPGDLTTAHLGMRVNDGGGEREPGDTWLALAAWLAAAEATD